MKILVITSSYPRHAQDHAGHFVQAEVEALEAEGHAVTLACPGPLPPESSETGNRRATLILGGAQLFGPPGAWPRLKEDPRRLFGLIQATWCAFRLRGPAISGAATGTETGTAFDKIVAHWLFPSALPWALIFGRQCTELEVVVHGSDLQLLLRLPQWLQLQLLRRLLRARGQLRFVSFDLKAQLLARPLPADLYAWVQDSAVRAAQLSMPSPAQLQALKVLPPQPEQQRVILVMGRLIESKRVEVALRAAALVPDATIHVIGDGPLRGALEAAFPEVNFLGNLPRNEALAWILACDLLLNASRLEGAPTTIREAMILGTPVVSTCVSDLELWAQSNPELWLVH